jgi:D-alanyl-lipoteichoic acid acyltransferase DltB (MBOAT superfamily)
MLFQSPTFLFVFLPAIFLLHLAVRGTVLRAPLLTVAGYIFYAWGEPWIAVLLFAVSALDFVVGINIDRAKLKRTKVAWLLASLCLSLGLLAVFKYSAWFVTSLNALMGAAQIDVRLVAPDIRLPPGISFYTFQSIAYVVDVFRGRIRAHRDVASYFAFVAFFPQLFAGPIERAQNLLPQIMHARPIRLRAVEHGFFLIAWGLFKKLVVADNLAGIVDLARGHPDDASQVVMILAFTFQIYADFSAYSDIARGAAKWFGVDLSRNFHTPYFALNPSDFWARWHISLSRWIRDYLYIPLGGNRGGRAETLRNLVLTMGLAGLWHGAGWYFIVWGLYHGALLALYRIAPIDEWLIKALGAVGMWLARAVMFGFVIGGWVFFLAGEGSLGDLFAVDPDKTEIVAVAMLFWGLALFTTPILISDAIGFAYRREFPDLGRHMPFWTKAIVYVLIFYGILFFGARESSEFIYFRF